MTTTILTKTIESKATGEKKERQLRKSIISAVAKKKFKELYKYYKGNSTIINVSEIEIVELNSKRFSVELKYENITIWLLEINE